MNTAYNYVDRISIHLTILDKKKIAKHAQKIEKKDILQELYLSCYNILFINKFKTKLFNKEK